MRAKVTLSVSACAISLIALGASTLALRAQAGNPQSIVDAAYAKFKTLQEGKNADYIPALAKVDPKLFGIALVTVDGKAYTCLLYTSDAADE